MNLEWRKSTYSGDQGNCVEVAEANDDSRLVRDTKKREGGTLRFSAEEWRAFIKIVKLS